MFQTARHLKGYEPHIISIGGPGYPMEEVIAGVRFHRIVIGKLYKRLFQKLTKLDPRSYAYRAAKIIRRTNPEIVHVHNAPQLYFDLERFLGPAGPNLVLHMHNEKTFPSLKSGSVIFAVSRYLANWYSNRHSQAITKVITNGADLDVIRPVAQRAHAGGIRAKLGIPGNKKVVLYIGRISPEKGVMDLVLAMHELRQKRSDVFLLLVGEFSQRKGQEINDRATYGEQLKAECVKMEGNCLWTGSVPPTVIQDYYHAGDLVVIPSEFEEPLCMVAIEAMAAGIPVLAAPRGGLPELITPGKTGYMIDNTKDPTRFAAQIDQLLQEPDQLSRIAESARAYVENHHGWAQVANQVREAYDAIRRSGA